MHRLRPLPDVFALPTACLLARADLCREIDGFDPAIGFHGEDIEFCWRLHHSGARVVGGGRSSDCTGLATRRRS